jgi:hypothetical protein
MVKLRIFIVEAFDECVVFRSVDKAAAKHDPAGAACAWGSVVGHFFMSHGGANLVKAGLPRFFVVKKFLIYGLDVFDFVAQLAVNIRQAYRNGERATKQGGYYD